MLSMKSPAHDRQGGREAGKGWLLYAALGILLLFLVLLVSMAWRIADVQDEPIPVATQSHTPPEVPQAEGAWDERVAEWRQMLKKSSDNLRSGKSLTELDVSHGVPSPGPGEDAAALPSPPPKRTAQVPESPAQDRETAGKTLKVEVLGEDFAPGGSVEIVWCSPDGTVWKRVMDRSFRVEAAQEGMVSITVKAGEAEKVTSARSSGKVFAVPW
jgi:hypothetical protein